MTAIVQVFGCLHDGAVHTRQQQASEKRRGTKSRGARQYGGSNLTAGYGDLKGAPVAASARHIGASGCFGRPWSRNGRATTARKPPASVHGGDLELLGSLLWRAPAWPVRAQRQSRPVLRLGNGDDGVMTCRSKLAPRRAAHHVRSPEEPIHAHIEFICKFSEPINVKRSHPRKVEIHRRRAKRIRSLLAVAAGLCKVRVENCEI